MLCRYIFKLGGGCTLSCKHVLAARRCLHNAVHVGLSGSAVVAQGCASGIFCKAVLAQCCASRS